MTCIKGDIMHTALSSSPHNITSFDHHPPPGPSRKWCFGAMLGTCPNPVDAAEKKCMMGSHIGDVKEPDLCYLATRCPRVFGDQTVAGINARMAAE